MTAKAYGGDRKGHNRPRLPRVSIIPYYGRAGELVPESSSLVWQCRRSARGWFGAGVCVWCAEGVSGSPDARLVVV